MRKSVCRRPTGAEAVAHHREQRLRIGRQRHILGIRHIQRGEGRVTQTIMGELLHGGRVAEQRDKRTEHHQRAGGADTFGALGVIRSADDIRRYDDLRKQLVVGAAEMQIVSGENKPFFGAFPQADG